MGDFILLGSLIALAVLAVIGIGLLRRRNRFKLASASTSAAEPFPLITSDDVTEGVTLATPRYAPVTLQSVQNYENTHDAVDRRLWVGSTSDRTVWRCSKCATINDWSATVCGYSGKSYGKEEKMWECSYCFTVNSWSARKCGHCDKEYKG
jgi:hypothetical protein